MRRLLWGLAVPVTIVAMLVACSDDKKDAGTPSCDAIVEACHPLDKGSGPIHECHESAEEGATEASCAAKKAECLAVCKPDAGS
jgi:hypothetical protein